MARAEPSDPADAATKLDGLKALMKQYQELFANELDEEESIYAQGMFPEAQQNSEIIQIPAERNGDSRLTVYGPSLLMRNCNITPLGPHAALAQQIDAIFHELDELIIRLPRNLPHASEIKRYWIELRLRFLRSSNDGSIRLSYLCELVLNQGTNNQSLLDLFRDNLNQMATNSPLTAEDRAVTSSDQETDEQSIISNQSTANPWVLLFLLFHYNLYLHKENPLH
ncbi:MAG TPA: hypothetical protein DIU37_00845 [Opitutae bacterium]|nr:hypothetical protein [Opitutae bacterium]